MITLEDYLMGRDKDYPLTEQMSQDASMMVATLAILEKSYGTPLVLTSGYRPAELNVNIPGACAHDAHTRCAGVDLRNSDGDLSAWCLNHLDILTQMGVWMESPQSAKNHVHLQLYPPASGHRVFIA